MLVRYVHADNDFETATGTTEFDQHQKFAIPRVGDLINFPPDVYPYECEVDSVTWDLANAEDWDVLIEVVS